MFHLTNNKSLLTSLFQYIFFNNFICNSNYMKIKQHFFSVRFFRTGVLILIFARNKNIHKKFLCLYKPRRSMWMEDFVWKYINFLFIYFLFYLN